MPYDYPTQKSSLLSFEAQRGILELQDRCRSLLATAGAVRLQEAAEGLYHHFHGDSWTMLAAFDFLVEHGTLREVSGPGEVAQHRVFVAGRNRG